MYNSNVALKVVTDALLINQAPLKEMSRIADKPVRKIFDKVKGYVLANPDMEMKSLRASRTFSEQYKLLTETAPGVMADRYRLAALNGVLMAYGLSTVSSRWQDVQDVYMRKLVPLNPVKLAVWTEFHQWVEDSVKARSPKVEKSTEKVKPKPSYWDRAYNDDQKEWLNDLKKFDVYYSYSDDGNVYSAGKAAEASMGQRAKELDMLKEWDDRFK